MRAGGALHRYRPGETGRSDILAEMQFEIGRAPDRQLTLRRMQVRPRQPEPESALERVVGAAGQDGETGVDHLSAGHRTNARWIDLEGRDAGAGPDLRPRRVVPDHLRGADESLDAAQVVDGPEVAAKLVEERRVDPPALDACFDDGAPLPLGGPDERPGEFSKRDLCAAVPAGVVLTRALARVHIDKAAASWTMGK